MSGGNDASGLRAQETDLKLAQLKDLGDECLLIYQLAVRKGFLSPEDLSEVALPPGRQNQCLRTLASLGLLREAGGPTG
jgi:hypothetical protein